MTEDDTNQLHCDILLNSIQFNVAITSSIYIEKEGAERRRRHYGFVMLDNNNMRGKDGYASAPLDLISRVPEAAITDRRAAAQLPRHT